MRAAIFTKKLLHEEVNKTLNIILLFKTATGKMKTKWEDRFCFEKNLRIQFDLVYNSESEWWYLRLSSAIWW